MTMLEIILCAALIALGFAVILVEVKLHKVLTISKRNTRMFATVIDILKINTDKATSIEDDYARLNDMTDKVENMLSDLLNGLVLVEKKTDDIVENLYSEKIKQINNAKDKTTISYTIAPIVTDELTDALNVNKRESIKTRIKLLCRGGKDFYTKYNGDDIVQLLRELSIYEDTSDFLDENPMVIDMLFRAK